MSVKIPYAYSNGTLSVEVRLKHAADVFLVDTVNYHKYQKGERFKYYGGHYLRSRVELVERIGTAGGERREIQHHAHTHLSPTTAYPRTAPKRLR